MPDRTEAQKIANRLRTLRAELADTEISAVLQLTSDQRSRFDVWASGQLSLLERDFDVDVTSAQESLSWGMKLAATFGGIALSASLILLFQRYWGYFDTWLQLAFGIAVPLLCLAGAEYSAKRERSMYFAGLFSLVGLAGFVLNLYVAGRAFNITPTEHALLAWGCFSVCLAYRYGQRLMLAIGLLLLVSYGCAVFNAARGYHWLDFYSRPEHAAILAVCVWCIPRVVKTPGFEAVYRATGSVIFFFVILTLAEGEPVTYLPFATKTVQGIYEIVGLLTAACSVWLGLRQRWEGQVILGATVFSILLALRFYTWWWNIMPSWLFFALIGSIGVCLVAALKHLRRRT